MIMSEDKSNSEKSKKLKIGNVGRQEKPHAPLSNYLVEGQVEGK